MSKYNLEKSKVIINTKQIENYDISNLLELHGIKRIGKGIGKNKYYHCPFHEDEKESFTVSKVKNEEYETAICWSNICKSGGKRFTYLELYNALCEKFDNDGLNENERLIKIIESDEELKRMVSE